ncbi:hypothetical protein IQ250_04560 [Pseudanabaenaceae cyanobacterium LEGE 13415]|nr:hypothetical protein [Pseudanabaenaceae cyanobacterium LEGE 13415]
MQQNLPDPQKPYRDLSDRVSDKRFDIETLKPVGQETSLPDLIKPVQTRPISTPTKNAN